jgi:hypothetical protein
MYVTGTPGATVAYTFTEGTFTTSGTGVLSSRGNFGASIDVSTFPDGQISVVVNLTSGGVVTKLTWSMGKNSVAPPAPTASVPVYVNLAGQYNYTVTVTGQVGSIANVVLSDGGTPLPNVANGMDMIGSSGSVAIPIDASNLKDGPVSVSVTLTNGAGDSVATTTAITKDTVPPVLTVSGVPAQYLNSANIGSSYLYVNSETGAMISYLITDGVHTYSGSKAMNSSGQWNVPQGFSGLNDGKVTVTITSTDPAGNPTVLTYNLVKDTVAPVGSFGIAGTTINGQLATNNPALSVGLAFTDATSGLYQVALSTNGGSTYGAAQPYTTSTTIALAGADGLYTIAVKVFDAAGNSAVFTRTVRLDRAGPAIGDTITAPSNSGSYDVSQKITLTYSGSDTDNVGSIGAVLDGTTAVATGGVINAETLGAGTHSIVITATDGLGNVSTTTITITVHATVGGLGTAVNDGVTGAKITSTTTASQLLSYLSSAQAALNANNHTAAKSYLASFVSLVQAQSGVTINAAYAALLVGWANDLISRL